MTVRIASCSCGQLTAACEGEPVRVSVCHCLACQRRSGSAFAAQARFPIESVTVTGAFSTWSRVADSGGRSVQRFCPTCGSTLVYDNDLFPGLLAVPLGAFADPGFPPPRFSVYESRRHPWTTVAGPEVEHHD
jgi:hypothetical protein